jgi:hypothetical protein
MRLLILVCLTALVSGCATQRWTISAEYVKDDVSVTVSASN